MPVAVIAPNKILHANNADMQHQISQRLLCSFGLSLLVYMENCSWRHNMTCIAAGQTDYVVDALALHDHMHLLRPILADPIVLKVTFVAKDCTQSSAT